MDILRRITVIMSGGQIAGRTKEHDMKTLASIATGLLLAGIVATPAFALPGYPISGKWTYDDAAAPGPAKKCDQRMEFLGNRRLDTKGSIHDYRNVSVTQSGNMQWRIIDEFINGQISYGRVTLVLTQRDPDHIEVLLTAGGQNYKLRRCE